MVVAVVRADRDATRRAPLTTLPPQAVAVVRVLQQSMRAKHGVALEKCDVIEG